MKQIKMMAAILLMSITTAFANVDKPATAKKVVVEKAKNVITWTNTSCYPIYVSSEYGNYIYYVRTETTYSMNEWNQITVVGSHYTQSSTPCWIQPGNGN